MRIFLAVVLALLPSAACADIAVGNGTVTSPANYTVISGTTAVVAKSTPGVLLGANTTGIQTNALTCYDNASAASGNILVTATLGTVGGGLSGMPGGGINATAGIICQVPTAIVGTVVVFWR